MWTNAQNVAWIAAAIAAQGSPETAEAWASAQADVRKLELEVERCSSHATVLVARLEEAKEHVLRRDATIAQQGELIRELRAELKAKPLPQPLTP